MTEAITWVGLDAHKATIQVAMLLPGGAAPVEWQVANEPAAVKRLARKVQRAALGEVRSCYEAGVCGYTLQRQLAAAEMPCTVIAPALIPRKAGELWGHEPTRVIDCRDNCQYIANANQSDIDGDGIGDVCDENDCDPAHPYCLNITRLIMKGASKPEQPGGRASIQGDFVVAADVGFDASKGLAVRVEDHLEHDYQMTAGDPQTNPGHPPCLTTARGSKCQVNEPGQPQLKIRVKPLVRSSGATEQTYRFTVRFGRRTEQGPFKEPVVVTLTEIARGLDQVGQISDCAAKGGGIACRER